MSPTAISSTECDRIRERYARRKEIASARYSPLAPDVIMTQQEKVRALVRLLKRVGGPAPEDARLLEIGCGHGQNLLLFLSLGFRPDHLVGNELLEDRVAEARAVLPRAVAIIPGDAAELALPDHSFDIVFQSTVFTSILDDAFRMQLARRMWQLVKPGGYILWYDFAYNNPRNPDVRGIRFREIEALFPEGRVRGERITLAPPIARIVSSAHTGFYTLLNTLPFLRTHWLCSVRRE